MHAVDSEQGKARIDRIGKDGKRQEGWGGIIAIDHRLFFLRRTGHQL